MTARKSQDLSISKFLGLTLVLFILSCSAIGQTTSTPQMPPSNKPSQIKPVPLTHLYWHFLTYVNHLDTKSAELAAQGKDGRLMHDHLQQKSGLSDADFAIIRTSSVRLTAKIKALDAQAAEIRAADPSSSGYTQLQALTAQREADINAEITYLKQALSPEKIKAFETFLTQFFSPNNAIPRPPIPTAPQAPVAVR